MQQKNKSCSTLSFNGHIWECLTDRNMLATQIPLWYLATVCFWSWHSSLSLTWAILSQHVISFQLIFLHQFHQLSSISRTLCSHLTGTNTATCTAGTEPTNTSVPRVRKSCPDRSVLGFQVSVTNNPLQQAHTFRLCLSPRIVCAFAAAITVTFTQERASQCHRFGAIILQEEVWSGPLRPCFLMFLKYAMPLCG